MLNEPRWGQLAGRETGWDQNESRQGGQNQTAHLTVNTSCVYTPSMRTIGWLVGLTAIAALVAALTMLVPYWAIPLVYVGVGGAVFLSLWAWDSLFGGDLFY